MASARPNPSSNHLRLQRYLAACGLGSRRACEDLIRSGVVTVDGEPITEMGVTVDPASQVIQVKGQSVHPQGSVYYAVHKPPGVMCTSYDPQGRRKVLDLLPPMPERVYTVGRLDLDSEGLLLVTNDGDFAHRLTHPRHHVQKVYHVWLRGRLNAGHMNQCLQGVPVEGETLRALAVEEEADRARGRRYRVVLGEGKKRHIRRMFAGLGHRVVRLVRVQIGPLQLGSLLPGRSRPLTADEVAELLASAR